MASSDEIATDRIYSHPLLENSVRGMKAT